MECLQHHTCGMLCSKLGSQVCMGLSQVATSTSYLATSLMEVGPGEVGDDLADVPTGQSPYSASQTLLPSAVTLPLTHCSRLSLVWAAAISLIRHVTHANCLWCSLPID